MTMDEIKRKYDEIVIRCALTHLVDIGMQSAANDDLIESTIKEIREKETKRKEGVPIVSANFQIQILRAANDIAKAITPADLFVWVRNNLKFAKTKDETKLAKGGRCPTCGELIAELCPCCDETFTLSWVNYCPYCGQRVEVVSHREDEEEVEEDDDCD